MTQQPIEWRRRRLAGALCIAAVFVAPSALSQTYPIRPIRLVVPFSPGGAADSAARLIATKIAERVVQTVVVDNRPGAGGVIGSEVVANASADGYTLLWVNANHATNPSLRKTLRYDTERDFTPISLIATTAFVLVAHPSLQATSVADLVRIARAKPGGINYASLGNGSGAHFAAELFQMKARVHLTHVPYKGIAQAMPDLLAGTVPIMFPNVGNANPHVRAGRLRALAVTGTTRVALMPQVPTVQQSGITDYEFSNWLGLLAPRATPSSVVLRLGESIGALAHSRDVQTRLANDGAVLVASSPDFFREHIAREISKYAMLVSHIGLKPE